MLLSFHVFYLNFFLETWKVISQMAKKSELVREIERYQLDMVGLTWTHSMSSGTNLLLLLMILKTINLAFPNFFFFYKMKSEKVQLQ